MKYILIIETIFLKTAKSAEECRDESLRLDIYQNEIKKLIAEC